LSSLQKGKKLSEAHKAALRVPKTKSPVWNEDRRKGISTETLVLLYKQGYGATKIEKKNV
jgi:hypothetical protein